MRYATPLKPRDRTVRTTAEIRRWRRKRERWFATLQPEGLFQRLFDHIPGVYFFAKDRDGHLMFASKGLMQRYRMRDDSEIIGRTDFDLNPDPMAKAYVDDDHRLLEGKAQSVERIELWWDTQGMPDWYLVTKLPIRGTDGSVQGVMGTLRRPDQTERSLPVFQTVAKAVEIIRRDYATPLRIEDVATACGQSLRQLQRHFQSAFGITPQEFLIKTRVLAATRLIETTAMSLGEISVACGFVDQSAFAQHYKRRTGDSPHRYRKRLHGSS